MTAPLHKNNLQPIKNGTQKKSEEGFFKSLGLAILFAVLIRSFLYEPFHIPSGSMKPNLLIGDYIFVSKFSYGYSRYSFPFGLPFFQGRILGKIFSQQPQRGDIAVFRLPNNPDINYVKRIIGLPNDKIQMKEGVLFINNIPLKQTADGMFLDNQNNKKLHQLQEEINPNHYISILNQESTDQDDTGVYTVPENHYFMMGDNRDNSQDSRFLQTVGYVPSENLIGKVSLIFFSLDLDNLNFANFSKIIRYGRIFLQPK
jgi:signal peptidase I